MPNLDGNSGLRSLLWLLAFACTGVAASPELTDGTASVGQPSTTTPQPQAAQPAAPQPLPSLAELERQGAVIGAIHIDNVNVFDLEDPKDDKALFRLANKLHIRTRPDVVRQQLLFKSGDRLSARVVSETERILRANDYLFEARVRPLSYQDGVVDLEVRTQDVWTLNPGISLERSGGENSFSFEIEESNLLGFGKELKLARKSDVDRRSTLIEYSDPHLLGSWNRLKAGYSSNSDGEQRQFALYRPFYSLDSRWTAGTAVLDWDRIDNRYDLGEIVDEFEHQEEHYQVFGGISRGLSDSWVQRWTFGFNYQRDRFAPLADVPLMQPLPEDRQFAYPFVAVDLLEDRFEERRNENQIARTEDRYTGVFLSALAGWSSESLGADRDALILSVAGGGSFEWLDRRHTLLLAAEGNTRVESGDLRNTTLTADAQYFWRRTRHQLTYASITGTVTRDLDAERQLLLGGDAAGLTGYAPRSPSADSSLLTANDVSLRGYPLRYQDGASMALLTLEHRVFTDYYLFRLFHLGGAVFFDVGRTWGTGNGGGTSQGWLKDIGLGLRLGSSRSSFGNVIHIDLAFPLDGDDSIDDVQVLVETKRSF